jgi:DNA-binding NtrC family response regulator
MPRPGVLVVDDDHMVRAMVQLGLERNGFEVWLASNGREAMELYRKHKDSIAVVLLDARMPDLEGPAVLDALRALNPEVSACVMSGDALDHTSEALRQHKAACFIAKPFYLDYLTNVIRLLAHGVPAILPSAGGVGQAEPGETQPCWSSHDVSAKKS